MRKDRVRSKGIKSVQARHRSTHSTMMNIEYKNISELQPYADNPRRNDDAVQYVANSIREFGFKVPVIIDKNNVVVAGHTRLKACEKLGITEVPCIVADDLTDEQVKAFRLADNKVGEMADWDFAKLDLELENIDLDMTEFGFDFSEPLPTERVDLSGEITEQYQVIIDCKDEIEQEDVFNELEERGYKCRVLTL